MNIIIDIVIIAKGCGHERSSIYADLLLHSPEAYSPETIENTPKR